MIKEYQLRLLPRQAANESALKDYLAHEEGLSLSSITHVRVLKRSIDARQRTIFVNLKVRVYIDEQPSDDDFVRTHYPDNPVGAVASLHCPVRSDFLIRPLRI